MKKTTKKFVLSSEAKNTNGFHVRTAGIDLVDYNANPLMLWMHKRPKGDSKDEVLPIGNVIDIELVDGKLYGRLAFDSSDPFAMSLYEKVENGTLRMVSAGLIPLTWAKDADGNMWLETSRLKEMSLVDIGSNAEAISVALYDPESETKINLSLKDINTILKPENEMKLIQLSAVSVLPLLQLAEGATPDEALEAITELVTLADTQKTIIAEKETANVELKSQLDAQIKLASEAKIITLLDDSEAKGKFVKGDRAKWEKLANIDFDGTKDVLLAMPESKSVASQLKTEDADDTLLKLSYDELDKSDQLIKLKEQNPTAFQEKFKEKFNKEYTGQ